MSKPETTKNNLSETSHTDSTKNTVSEVSIIDLIAILWENKLTIIFCITLSSICGVF